MKFLVHPIFGRIALYSIFVVSVFTLICVLILLQHLEFFSKNQLPAQVPVPNGLSTDVWGLFNPETGELFAGSNKDKKVPIASITKLFTAEAVMESERKDLPFAITFSDVNTEGKAGKLIVGETTTLYRLLFPLLLESSNDAGVAIQRILGNEFETSVTTVLNSLALKNTEIHDATGLHLQNESSVEDLAIFFSYLSRTEPHILDITQLKMYVGQKTGYINNDPAQSLEHFRGGKHGYTDEAKHTFVGSFFIPSLDKKIGIIVLKSDDLKGDIQKLLTYSATFK